MLLKHLVFSENITYPYLTVQSLAFNRNNIMYIIQYKEKNYKFTSSLATFRLLKQRIFITFFYFDYKGDFLN